MTKTVLLALLLTTAAQADIIQVNLTNTTLTGAPGDILQVFGTLTNPSDTDTIYINGTTVTSASSFLTLDITPFYLEGIFSLTPGQTTDPFEIFDIDIDPAAPAGPYIGNTVSFSGGADGGTFSIYDDLADPTVDVIVNSASTTAPEPSTFLLLLLPLAWIVGQTPWSARDAPVPLPKL